MQPGGHFLQPQQAQQMMTQSLMAARSSMLYGQQPQLSTLQQQQAALYSQLGMGSGVGSSGGFHILQTEAAHGGGSFGDFDRAAAGLGGGLKAEMGGSEARGGSSAVDGGETLYLKAGDGEH